MTKSCYTCSDVLVVGDNWTPSSKKNGQYQCSPCKNEEQRKRYHADTDKQRCRTLQKNYGITLDEYDAMLESQEGCCAICRTDDPKGRGRFHVDHNHDTGEVRGLLCHSCNTAIGALKDDPIVVLNAAHYLLEKGHYG